MLRDGCRSFRSVLRSLSGAWGLAHSARTKSRIMGRMGLAAISFGLCSVLVKFVLVE